MLYSLILLNPVIINSDQRSPFTSDEYIGLLKDKGIQISMDGKEGMTDNIFINVFGEAEICE